MDERSFWIDVLGLVATVLMSLIIVGHVLARWVLRPNGLRFGRTPHCGHCDHDLSHVQSSRCPACGTLITPENTVHGDPLRKHLLIAKPGRLALLCFGTLLPLAITIHGFYTYGLYPTSWLIDYVQSSNPRKATRAWNQLEHRVFIDRITDQQQAELLRLCVQAEAKNATTPEMMAYLKTWTRGYHIPQTTLAKLCLEALTTQTTGPVTDCIIGRLAELYEDGQLSKGQKQRFFRQLLHVSLQIASPAPPGEQVHFERVDCLRTPKPCHGALDLPVWAEIVTSRTLLDGKPIGPNAAGIARDGTTLEVTARTVTPGTFPCTSPGPHTLEMVMTVKLFNGAKGTPGAASLCFDGEVSAKAAFETQPVN
ncbi:MAG: hypothetical protein JXQ73_10455 [Phycisphaerae bacterium]|nr:hypothetical protein [Phycisphaerae bacterium]